MTNELNTGDEPSETSSPSDTTPPAMPSSIGPQATIGQIVAAAFRSVNAVWLAPLFYFLILGPQQMAGVLAFVLVEDFTTAATGPPTTSLILMGLIGIGSCFWYFVLLFGLPWVTGGAASHFKHQLVRPERQRSYVEDANFYFGPSLVILLLCGLLLAVLYMPIYAFQIYTMMNSGLMTATTPPDMQAIMQANFSPQVVATLVLYGLLATAVMILGGLCLAATVTDELGPIQAIRRGLTFVRGHWRDLAKLFLLIVVINIPVYVVQQMMLQLPLMDWAVLAMALTTSIYSAYVLALILALTVTLYVARMGRAIEAGSPSF